MKKSCAAFGLAVFLACLIAAINLDAAALRQTAESGGASSQQQNVAVDPAEKYTEEGEELEDKPVRRAVKWNEYELKYFTLKFGFFGIVDYGTGQQDENSKKQVYLPSDMKLRDLRVRVSGKLMTQRNITYTAAFMYDAPTNSIFVRETGVQVAIPELWGYVFAGRQKEGFSLSKITVGYAVPTFERMPANDAMVPILADGIKWLGVAPDKHANWNLAWFNNYWPKSPATNWYDTEWVARFCWVPLHPDDQQNGTLLHLGAAYRWATVSDATLRLRSRPESYTATYFLDTGDFPADFNDMAGLEAYYRPGPLLYGFEYIFNKVHSPQTRNPFFHGGEALVAYVFTGEKREYHDIGGKLGFVFPKKSVFEGGPGAIEGVLHLSYSDFDGGTVSGGTFWRLTPQVSWYLDSTAKLAAAYGIGVLDRFGLQGVTQFFQLRVQLQFD